MNSKTLWYTLDGAMILVVAILFLGVAFLTWPLYLCYRVGKWFHSIKEDLP